MYLIAVYDIENKTPEGRRKLNRIRNLFRKYLYHTQKSVFEGEINESKYFSLLKETEKIINNKDGYVVFFQVEGKYFLNRKAIGETQDPTANII